MADPNGGLDVCILSRKDLGPVTRVPRQAEALQRAGHRVTVVSIKRPCDELLESTPGVEYIEVEPESWTRRRLIALRERRKERQRERWAHDRDARQHRGWRLKVLSHLRRARMARDRIPSLLLALPSALLLSSREESVWARTRELAGLDAVRILGLYAQVLAQAVSSRSFAEKTCHVLDGRGFDVVQAHDNYALVAAKALATKSGAELIYDAVEITEHRLAVRRTRLSRLVERYQRRQEARIFKRARAVITVGDGLADWYAARYGIERPLPVRNCRWFWDYEPCEDIRRDCGIAPDDRLVVWFGYSYPDQGVESIIATAQRVPGDVHFALIAGVLPRWTDFHARMQALARELGLERRVHFLPPRDPNELVPYASGGDIGIIPRPNVGPNVYYSMPNKFMEMVMARLPVAVSDLVDMRTLIERYGIGRVFDVQDPDDIGRTLEAMLEPTAHAELRERVMDAARYLCWENESRRYVELFGPAPRVGPRELPPRSWATERGLQHL